MDCEFCKKNPATIHIQEIVKGQKKSLHICAECAQKKGLSEMALQGINLAEILYKISSNAGEELTNLDAVASEREEENFSPVACSVCGWDSRKFNKTGRLGCAGCYKAFSEILGEALKTMHRGTTHVGKRPRPKDIAGNEALVAEIVALQKRLDEHVRREEYEKAAEARDRLKALRDKAGEKVS